MGSEVQERALDPVPWRPLLRPEMLRLHSRAFLSDHHLTSAPSGLPRRASPMSAVAGRVAYSSLPATCASTLPLPTARSTTEPFRTYVRPRQAVGEVRVALEVVASGLAPERRRDLPPPVRDDDRLRLPLILLREFRQRPRRERSLRRHRDVRPKRPASSRPSVMCRFFSGAQCE
jgi:hypothetical protein